MMQPEERVKSRVGDDGEVSIHSPSDCMDRVVNGFKGIICTIVVIRNPGLVTKGRIVGVVCKNVVQPLLEAW